MFPASGSAASMPFRKEKRKGVLVSVSDGFEPATVPPGMRGVVGLGFCVVWTNGSP